MNIKSCCFIGHRKINVTEELTNEIEKYIEDLIVNKNVGRFLVGSRSEFNDLCHSILDKLKHKYPFIEIVAYDCSSEKSFLEIERNKWEKIFSRREGSPVHIICVDKICDYKSKYTAGRASYVERNYAMIDASEYCLFYYNNDYLPPKRKYSKRNLSLYQPKSGTELAYNYAKSKQKNIKNFFK